MKNILIIIITLLLIQGCFKLGNNKASTPTDPVYTPIDSLITPTLTGGKVIDGPGYSLWWSRSKDGCTYQLEESYSDDFIGSALIYSGSDRVYTAQHSNYYRVRAIYLGFVSDWSNVIAL